MDDRYKTLQQTFVVKLPYTTGGNISGKRITIKFCKDGVNGILAALKELVIFSQPFYLITNFLVYLMIN
jgi:hypothetical protein